MTACIQEILRLARQFLPQDGPAINAAQAEFDRIVGKGDGDARSGEDSETELVGCWSPWAIVDQFSFFGRLSVLSMLIFVLVLP